MADLGGLNLGPHRKPSQGSNGTNIFPRRLASRHLEVEGGDGRGGGVWRTRVGVEPETPRVQSTGGKVLGISFFFLRHLPLKLYLCSPAFWKKKLGSAGIQIEFFSSGVRPRDPPRSRGAARGAMRPWGVEPETPRVQPHGGDFNCP